MNSTIKMEKLLNLFQILVLKYHILQEPDKVMQFKHAAAIIASVNNANLRNIQQITIIISVLYDEENYTITQLQQTMPIVKQNCFNIWSFNDKCNRIFKYIPIEIVLTKSGNNSHCVYGQADNLIDFSGNN